MVALIIAFLIAFAIGPVAASAGPRAVVEHLSALGSRVAGYPGSVQAAEYVEERLQALGLTVRRDSFAVVVPMDKGGRLEWEDESVPLYAVWPNGARTSTVPPEGLRAPAIWGGDGDWGDFNGQEVAGRVVVLDFASGDNWLKAASLGAVAVVFVAADSSTTQQAQGKYVRAPLDVPRFWVEGAAGERLRRRLVDGAVEVGLWGRMDWQERMAYNVWAVVPGKDAGTAQNETVLVHAYYDAPSVVPARAPGAEAAVSVAALLEVAARLQANPPAHTVVLAALSAHFQGRQGMVAFLDRHARRQEHYAARVAEPLNIDLFIGLDLSSHGERVVLWNNTDSYALKRFFVPFGRRFAEYAEALGRAEAVANGISPIRGMDWDSYMPGGLAADGELALEAGFPSLTLATVGDVRFALDLPLDTGAGVAWDNVEGQAALVADLLAHALADTALLAGRERLDEALKDRLRDLRVKARTFPRRSQVPDRPVARALVAVQVEEEERKGVRNTRYFLTDAAGLARIPGLVQGTYPLAVAALDAERGTLTHVVDLSKRAQAHHGKPRADGRLGKNVRWTQNEQIAVLFPGVDRTLYGLVEPRLLRAMNEVKVLSADGGEPGQYGYALGKSSIGSVGVIYGPADAAADDRVKVILDDQLLLLNSEGSQSEIEARGRGFLLAEEGFGGATLQAARDVWNLDAVRLGVLKEHGIENQRLTRLHAQAAAAIAEAEAAAEQLKWDEYIAWSRKALGLETRAYPEVLATLNDVLEGVIFFMALLLPAAFFGERLLFAAADIRRQLAGFGLLLLAIWLILAQVHPAFELAEPLVVLLAFAIMAMAVFVLFMVVGRFNRVMAQHQSQQTRVHSQDLSRLSASYAAFMLGISNMRRRPLRTGLTLATLTLLTFTLLSFTSFEQQIRYASFRLPHAGVYPGILIRDRGWERLTPEALDYAESHFGGSGWMGRRGWYAAEGGKGNWIAVAAAGKAVRATGLLGLTPEEAQITEVDASLVAGSFFAADDEATCILPLDMAEALGIGVGDWVEVFGRTLAVRGIADSERLGELRDLDGESLMPADFVLSGAEMLQLGAARDVDIAGEEDLRELRPFIHLEPHHVVIVPYQTLAEAGGSLRSVAVRFPGATDGQALVEDYLTRVAATLFVGSPDGRVTALSSVGLTAVQGLGALAIPALVAALIVLNAMMGAVYERLREISIYSSVGLAPLHIALLFVAEACVYAVLGTTLGYLLGQGLGRVLLGLGLLQGLTLNYSSLAAIGAALAVMGVVLLSTIYPARVAARQAVPDVVRRWRPDPPSGDEWLFEFPFMLGEGEVEGVCGFLANYFGAFGRATLGDFYVEDMQVAQADGYRLSFALWLAPFDLGVSQEVVVEFVPAGERARAMEVRLRRVSGERHYWQRLNLRLVEALRKQMLIWYALRETDRVQHVESARTLAAEQVEERVEEQAAAEQPASFTWRGFAVGALLALCIGVGAPYAIIMLQGSFMALNSSSPGAIFLFFVLVVVVNTLLRALGRGLALGRADLVLIYAMMLLASAVPTQAFVGYLIPIISGLYYYATPENNWGETFFPHVTPWLAPQDRQAIVDLHEGLPPGGSIPWAAWSETLSYWYVFFLVLSFMMLCMSSILHRQWSQHERLAYPMVQLPLKMVEEGRPGFKLGPLFKQRLLWIGFAVPFVLLSFKGLHYYFPAVPLPTQSAGQLSWIGNKLNLHWVYAWIGFFYLVNLDISFSIWFFYVFNKAQEGIFTSLGIASTEKLSLYSYSQTADLTHEVMGACLIFVGYTLWMGRRHLGAVWRKAWRGDPTVDDAGEMLSYRVAFFGFLASLLFVGAWLWASGVPLAILPLFLLVCLLFYVFVTRAVATAGLATARSPMVAAFFVISAVGAPVIGAKGLTALTFTYVWQSEMRLFPMIAAANSLKLALRGGCFGGWRWR
ncbi:MAG: M28 family peptidase [Candidatus Latescibacteria bacterium]|nr:M28 family peptidase [Candidatus Latescibacterota bacterium]